MFQLCLIHISLPSKRARQVGEEGVIEIEFCHVLELAESIRQPTMANHIHFNQISQYSSYIKNGNNSFISNISFMDPESKLDSKNLTYFRVNLETNVKFL